MKTSTLLILTLTGVCTVIANPTSEEHHPLILRQRRDIDILSNTRKIIEQLVEDLRQCAQQAIDAVGTFHSDIQGQVKLFREKIVKDIEKLKKRVTNIIQNITDKITSSGTAVKECINSHRKEADLLFNDTLHKTMTCADTRIKEVSELIEKLTVLSHEGIECANNALEEMRNCTAHNSRNILAVGACLGTVAVRTEMKGAILVTQTGLSIARINLALATLPVALEICAGTRLVEAGLGTSKIVMEIGTCSASSIFSNFTGNAQ